MNSFDLGAIFPDRSGHELSRNVGAVSIYAFLKKLYWGIGPGMQPKNERKFRNGLKIHVERQIKSAHKMDKSECFYEAGAD